MGRTMFSQCMSNMIAKFTTSAKIEELINKSDKHTRLTMFGNHDDSQRGGHRIDGFRTGVVCIYPQPIALHHEGNGAIEK